MKIRHNSLKLNRIKRSMPILAIFFFLISISCQAQTLDRLTFETLSENGHFGKKLNVHNSSIVVAEPNYTETSTHSGRVHVFEKDGDNWLHSSTLTVEDEKAYANFGYDIVQHDNDLIISAPGLHRGVVFFYSKESGDWQLVQQITMPSELLKEGLHIRFGENVELHDGWLAISAPGYMGGTDAITRTGGVFMFRKEGENWVFHQLILSPTLDKSTHFGAEIELTPTWLVITAPKGNGGATESGVVYLYRLEGDQWVPDFTFINPSSRSHELFGADVDLHDNIIAIGAPMHTEDAGIGPKGAVHVFLHFNGTWISSDLLQASDGNRNDMFGASVAVESGNIVVGAPRFDDDGKTDLGKVYLYNLQSGFWTERVSYLPLTEDIQSHMQFGSSLSLHDNQLVMGGHLMNNTLDDSGVAYVANLETIVSTENPDFQESYLTLKPNPVTDVMEIQFSGNWSPDLWFTNYDMGGRPVSRDKTSENIGLQYSFDATSLIPGTYFLHVTDGMREYICKWIKI